ncbi:Vms1/Ankzf1 family peptidyl-tRNA hydrolase [Streptomyces sp. NPDC003077]|uniref:baeRF2 domain-containing protein n=1 Tax=Streptomyces sp. NPDC003077 TaxID=3154443 RepID=UPI0033B32A06
MQLGFLTPVLSRPGPWASVYFGTAQHMESTPEMRAVEARNVSRYLAAQGAEQATCDAVHDELASLQHASEPAGRAIFATGGEVVLDAPLEASPPRGVQVSWSALPHVSPLVELVGKTPTVLLAYIDRLGADFELRGERETRPLSQVDGLDWPIHRTGRDDFSERHFQAAVENTWEHNAEEIARALAQCHQQTRTDLVILVGDPRERRSVHERLPQQLQGITVECEHGGRAAGARSVAFDQDIERIRAGWALRQTERELERFDAARGAAADRVDAVEGVPALVEAAREHRIAELIVHPDGPDVHREVWVGPGPDQLALRRSESQYLGEPDPVAARADDALLRSAIMADADVFAVPREPDTPHTPGVPVGGLGAMLRWPQQDQAEGLKGA